MSVTPKHRAGMFDLPRGTELGKYQILRRLATGGMAEIYLAKVRGTAGFEKLVVLKRILPHVAEDPAFVGMFLDEARLAATLQHPNIADVYDVGEDDGAPFYAMEYVHGQDVRSVKAAARAHGQTVPLAIGLAIVHGTASALDYAHEKAGPDRIGLGLVHRDVSSTNVMVSYDGAIKLLDFGIARATGRRHKTQTGTLKGKVPYMSPEQCRGQALDRRSDLFSLGVVMFELTVGRRPFRGDSDFEIMDQIVHHQAPAPSSIVRGYPEELEAMLGKLLAREPALRYQTAEGFLHDLDPFLAQHRLWVSAKPLGKYMRGLFADRITAWEQAMQGTRTLDDLLGEVTEHLSSSDLMETPAVPLPALPPLSQQMLAVHELEYSVPVRAAEVAEVDDAAASPDDAGGANAEPAEERSKSAVKRLEARPPRGRRVASVLAGLLIGAAGIAGYYAWKEYRGFASSAADTRVTEPLPRPLPPPRADDPAPAAAAAADPPPAAADPPSAAADPPSAAAGPPSAAAGPPPAAASPPTAAADPPTPGSKEPPEIEIEVPVTQPPAATAKPAVRPSPRPASTVKPPPAGAKPPPKTEPTKEPAWDPNSPFLPPSP